MLETLVRPARWLAVCAALALAGNALAATEQESMERALGYLQEGDAAAAIIEFKNAIQANPENAEARALLGEIYLRTNDPDSAVKELQRARELGRSDDRTLLLLVEARLQAGEYQTIVDEIPADRPIVDDIGAGLLAVRSQALFGLGQFEEARNTLERIVAEHPVEPAYAGLARMALYRGEVEVATHYLDEGLAKYPDSAQLQLLRGEQQMQAGQFEAARTTYEALSTANPGNLTAGVGVARAELALGRVESARVVIEDLLSQQPKNLALYLLRAVASLQARDYVAAQEDANSVLAIEDGNPAALYVAGAASYGLGQYEQALRALSRYVTLAPADASGRKLLAATQVRMGNADAARRTLGDDFAAADDPDYLALLSTASALSGDIGAGLRYLEQAVLQSPGDARLRAQLGLLRIAAGDASQGAADLDQALSIDPGLAEDPRYDRAEVALIQGYLKEARYDEALTAIRTWQEKHPDNAAGFVMEGVALTASGNEAEGREAFKRALEIKPGAPDASANLAILDLRNNDPESAKQILERVLIHHPDDLRTLLLLAQLAERDGERDKTRSWLERAVAAHPDSQPTRIFLSRLYIELNEPERALAMIAPVARDAPDNIPALEVKARAELRTGLIAESIATYEMIVARAPDAAQSQFELSQAYAAGGQLDKARAAAEAAIAADANHTAARFQLVKLALRQADAAGAETALAALEQTHPDAPELKELRGELLMLQGQPQQALAMFQEARKSLDISRLAVAEARAHAASGDRAAAMATLEQRIAANPQDTAVRFELNRYYLAENRKTDAEVNLRAIIDYQPDSWIARNDLAWMLYERGDFKAAQPEAERAHALASDNPAVMDTLGVILLELGDIERATALIRRANEGIPDNPEIGLHLAQAYAQGDRKDQARAILATLLEKHPAFDGRDRAAALLAELGG
jgi:putative PEP-CTERM system TPR-repeat lipoprotein